MKEVVLENYYEDLVISKLKKGVWLYFFLLIFEGALRKWVLPGFSESLLIIRDPLAIWLLYMSFKYGVWKINLYVFLIWEVSILALILTLIIGHGNLQVAIYGLRMTIIHFPLIFVIGNIFNKSDVLILGKIMLWLTIAMTLLVAVQFYSPQSAWVNRGVGGDLTGSGFSGAGGFFRVPGTFSFTNGLSLFYGLATAYIFYFWIGEDRRYVSKALLLVSSFALLAAVPLSISRTVLFEIALSVVFMMAIIARNPRIIKNIIGVGLISIFLFLIMGNFSFIEEPIIAFTERFTSGNRTEGGLVEGVFIDRFLGGMYSAIVNDKFPFWGMGLGMGTSVGANILVGNSGAYLIAEEEWPRVVGEMGMVFGMMVIFIRIGVVLEFLQKGWRAINKNNILPWMLMSFGMFNILQGQWSQPTTLGFSILIGGLVMASHNEE
ncbi:hypothetical protein L1I30_10925 [Gillisia sp. M10.2A]|uniref:O-antigen polymerase n=1 Tax=Gillisia lutea TaxID=2909668 RepID=A0ABS9EH32_9FLAO|nr:hypothetical protein [Gillisia lutea]MCF4102182.1 hypothetical protein [Gillisia lutea]